MFAKSEKIRVKIHENFLNRNNCFEMNYLKVYIF